MKFSLETAKPHEAQAEVIVISLFEDKSNTGYLPESIRKKIELLLKSHDFNGEKSQTYIFQSEGLAKAKRIMLAGMGKEKDFSLNVFMDVFSGVAKEIKSRGLRQFSYYLPEMKGLDKARLTRAFIETVCLSLYEFDRYTKEEGKKSKKKIDSFTILADKITSDMREHARFAEVVCEYIYLTRDLINTPSNDATPSVLTKIAVTEAKKLSISSQVFGRNEIKKMKMGLIDAVSKGSDEEPKLLVLKYSKGGKSKPICLVGKGVTFDTGGINLKPSTNINTMKYDMGGAATMISAMLAAAKLKLKANIILIAPFVENMPSGKSYKPDDIIRSYSGKTVEITNTDAEGRLILADALSYSLKFKPKCIIDAATLTGAALFALGDSICPVIGNNGKIIEAMKKASDESGENVWELPLADDYKDMLKGDISDLKNCLIVPGPGTISAAIFLSKFVDDVPWVHLDIAGVGWANAEKSYKTKGSTGFGVRLITQFLIDSCK